MSPTEITGASALARGSPNATQHNFSARSGADKATAIQSSATATAAAPVETARAVGQAQSAQSTRLDTKPDPIAAQASRTVSKPVAQSLAKPMTAVLLHELRLQQELADVQEEKGKKDG